MREFDNLTLNLQRSTVENQPAIAVFGPFNVLDQRIVDMAVEILAGGKTEVILDLSRVSFITSAGIACVIKIIKRIQAIQGNLFLYGINDDMKDYFRLIKLDRYLKFMDPPANQS